MVCAGVRFRAALPWLLIPAGGTDKNGLCLRIVRVSLFLSDILFLLVLQSYLLRNLA